MDKNNPKDDEQLVARLREPATCREAFGDVMRIYSEPLYWQIRRMVNNHDDANDLLQNTFMKAWCAIENFRGEAKLSTWLHKIAINESITFLEKERKRLNISLDDEESHLVGLIEADENIDGDKLALELLQRLNLLAALGDLAAPGQIFCFVRFFFHGEVLVIDLTQFGISLANLILFRQDL